jgi:ribose transport system substrate-binding protein
MRKGWLAALGAVLIVALGLAGCGDDDDSGQDSSTEDPPYLVQAKQATQEAAAVPNTILSEGSFSPKPDQTIYHVACDQALQGCANLAKAIEAAADAIGYGFEICDGGSSPDTIAQCWTNAVNAKPDAIITNGIGVDVAGDGYAAAAKANIPVVGMFTGNDLGVDGVVTEVAGDECGPQGEMAGNWVIADSGGDANVLFVGTQTFKCNQQRQSGFESAMQKCTECKVSTLDFAIDAIQSTLPQQLQAKLQSTPDVDYVVGTFDAIALVAADAVRQAGKADSIRVAGFDADAPNLELIGNEDIQFADVTSGTTEPGYAAVDAAARSLVGEEVGESTDVTSMIVTPANIQEVGDGYAGPTGFEQQFAELWGR